MTPLQLVVGAIDDTVPGIRTLRLSSADHAVLPSFTPGSHIVVECVVECGSVTNAYSLTGEPVAPREYTISVLKCEAGAGGSRWIHRLGVGDTVLARPPRSAFAPVLRARRHLLIAAGIGITPFVSHLRSARRWGREVELLYLYRDGRGAHVDEVKALADSARLYTERSAFLDELPEALTSQPFGSHLYVCGPASFIDAVVESAADLGWPPSRIHIERFGIDALDPGEPFTVRLAGTAESIVVESGVSLLEALEAQGHSVANLCRQGVCGECKVTVSGGDIAHRDMYLTEAERDAGDAIMCCVSRAAGHELELTL